MIEGMLSRTRSVWRAFLEPIIEDERRATRNVWEQLPESLQVNDQLLGRHSAGCAATYGLMEACDFKCTACYLAETANATPPLPLQEVKAQLDTIREYLGPGGNTQITAGEVTLLPCDELIQILNYCHKLQLSPMVMTHGQRLLTEPRYLERLVIEGSLDKVSIHIDTTQKGRLGMHARDTETDIHWIRDSFANLIRETRKSTRKRLAASTTYTVTAGNIDYISDVLEWCTDNADAFRMISFQPTADVGRNREDEQVGRRELVWRRICEGVGVRLNHETFKFGHPSCNSIALMFVIKFHNGATVEKHIMEVNRSNHSEDQAFFESLFHGGFAGFTPDGEALEIAFARLLGRIRLNPLMLFKIPSYSLGRLWHERTWIKGLLSAVASSRTWSINPFVVIVHNFMSAHELDTPEGQERLQACAFRVPVDGHMVSMCELNGTDMRRDMNTSDRDRLIPIAEPIHGAG
jgi:hypothetical protein